MVGFNDYKIIYAEDEAITNLFFTKILKRVSKNIYPTFNGKEAFEKYLEIKPDLIVTDLNMPIMHGCELIKKIRELDRTTPIIVVTAQTDLDHLNINLLKKPIDFSVFQRLVKKCLTNENDTNIEDELKIQEIVLAVM
ncbi:MAG: hypothetical protein C0602_12285 [Denitrovibrio sp.]|nr:MAG: hypothetical protein C0602_12285 [Denitrovibrio sp.]